MEEAHVNKTAFLCEYSEHVGDRYIRDPYERFIVTLDIMTADNNNRKERLHPFGGKGALRICGECRSVIVGRGRTQGVDPLQGTLL